MTGVTIDKNWSINPLSGTNNSGVQYNCNLCKSNEMVRKITIPKNKGKYGLHICQDCLIKITILFDMEAVRNGAELNCNYAKNKMYDYRDGVI